MSGNGNGEGRKPLIDARIASGIAVTITAVWSISFLADILIKDYVVDQAIHGVMLTVAGGIFAVQAVRK